MKTIALTIAALAIAAPVYALDFGQKDKQLHAIAGAGIYAASRVAGASPRRSLAICAAAGVLKEAYDATGRGNVEAADAIATVIPCLLMAAIQHRSRPTLRPHERYVPPPVNRRALIAYGNELARR